MLDACAHDAELIGEHRLGRVGTVITAAVVAVSVVALAVLTVA